MALFASELGVVGARSLGNGWNGGKSSVPGGAKKEGGMKPGGGNGIDCCCCASCGGSAGGATFGLEALTNDGAVVAGENVEYVVELEGTEEGSGARACGATFPVDIANRLKYASSPVSSRDIRTAGVGAGAFVSGVSSLLGSRCRAGGSSYDVGGAKKRVFLFTIFIV